MQNGQFKTDLHFVGDRPENIRTGKSYYINIELGEPTEAVMIPRGTFYQKTGGNWIYVLSPEGDRAFKRPIRIGRQNPQSYEVIEGLDPGEKVIVSSYETYGDNDILCTEIGKERASHAASEISMRIRNMKIHSDIPAPVAAAGSTASGPPLRCSRMLSANQRRRILRMRTELNAPRTT